MICCLILKMLPDLLWSESGDNSHAAIVGLTLDIPVILGAEHAVHILKSRRCCQY